MDETVVEKKVGPAIQDEWAERIAEQGRSGLSVKQFCKERRFSEYSFYTWRKRLRAKEPVRFALLERGVTRGASAAEVGLELVLTNGERLRISKQVDMATLRWCSMRCGDDSPAGQRAGVSVSEPLRHAPEF
jgi:hypothetical protein